MQELYGPGIKAEKTALNLQFSRNRVQRDGFFKCWDASGSDPTPSRGMDSGNTTTASNQTSVITAVLILPTNGGESGVSQILCASN